MGKLEKRHHQEVTVKFHAGPLKDVCDTVCSDAMTFFGGTEIGYNSTEHCVYIQNIELHHIPSSLIDGWDVGGEFARIVAREASEVWADLKMNPDEVPTRSREFFYRLMSRAVWCSTPEDTTVLLEFCRRRAISKMADIASSSRITEVFTRDTKDVVTVKQVELSLSDYGFSDGVIRAPAEGIIYHMNAHIAGSEFADGSSRAYDNCLQAPFVGYAKMAEVGAKAAIARHLMRTAVQVWPELRVSKESIHPETMKQVCRFGAGFGYDGRYSDGFGYIVPMEFAWASVADDMLTAEAFGNSLIHVQTTIKS
jgi:hypothetical protein